MSLNAVELGFDRTMQAIGQLLEDRFGFDCSRQGVPSDKSLFALDLGLSSLDGIEFLCELEKRFGVRVDDLEWWVYETPTLSSVARHIIELTRRQNTVPQ